MLYNERRFQYKDAFHLIPFLIVLINYLPFYLMPIVEKRKIVQLILENLDYSFTYQAGVIPENIINIFRVVSIIIYTTAQWNLIVKYKKHFKNVQIERQVHDIIHWLKIYAWSCTAHVIAFVIMVLFFLFNKSLFNSWGFLNLLPLIIYTVSFFIISSYFLIYPNVLNGLPFIKYKEMETNSLTNERSKVPFIEEDYSVQIEKIRQYFDDKKPYLNKNISLSQVSVELGLPIREVSYIVNNYYNNRFTDFINSYRIKYIINKINTSYLDQYTIESLALEAGFISKSGFYKSFKKLYNTTPLEYLESKKFERSL
jgi:AraC-like DNA-binding protein